LGAQSAGRAAAFVVVAAILVTAGVADDAGPADADLVAALGDAATRDAAADRLVARGAAATPALVAGLSDAKLRVAALDVIARIGPPAKDAVAPVANLVKLQASPARAAAARALAAIGADAAPALPVLAAWAGEAKGANRADAVRAIASIVVAQSPPPPPGKTPQTVTDAIAAGCDWLLRHQDPDGRFASGQFSARCQKGPACGGTGFDQYNPGVTGLAVLALLGAREDAADKPRFAAALRGAGWLAGVQDSEGFVGSRADMHSIYNHLCGGTALAATLRTGAFEGLRPHVEKAVAMTLAARSGELGGWRYEIPAGKDSDTSVTVWAADLLAAAADAGVKVGPEGLAGAMTWIDAMTDPQFGRCGYQQCGGPPARLNDVIQRYPPDLVETLTACGIHVRLLCGRKRATDPMIAKGLALVGAKPPVWRESTRTVDFYYWYHGSAAVSLVGGDDYTAWRKALVGALLPHQLPQTAGCARGSWDPADPWGDEAGRVYSTSMALLSLEACGPEPPPRADPTSAQARWIAAVQKAAQSDDATLKAAAASAMDEFRRRFNVK
jgi:hypothetical protein